MSLGVNLGYGPSSSTRACGRRWSEGSDQGTIQQGNIIGVCRRVGVCFSVGPSHGSPEGVTPGTLASMSNPYWHRVQKGP